MTSTHPPSLRSWAAVPPRRRCRFPSGILSMTMATLLLLLVLMTAVPESSATLPLVPDIFLPFDEDPVTTDGATVVANEGLLDSDVSARLASGAVVTPNPVPGLVGKPKSLFLQAPLRSHVRFIDSSVLNLQPRSSEYTLSIWVRVPTWFASGSSSASGNPFTVFSRGTESSSSQAFVVSIKPDGTIGASVGGAVVSSAAGFIATNRWTMVTLVNRRLAGSSSSGSSSSGSSSGSSSFEFSLHANGTLIGTARSGTSRSTNNVLIGARLSSTSGDPILPFSGLMRRFSFYSTPLTTPDVVALYDSSVVALPSETPTASPSASATVSGSDSVTPTASLTASGSGSSSATISGSGTVTVSLSATPTPSESSSITGTASQSVGPSSSVTGTGTVTASPSATVTVSVSGSETMAPTVSGTASGTVSATVSGTASVTETRSADPLLVVEELSVSSLPTVNPSESVTPAQSPSPTGSVSASPSETPGPSGSASSTPALTVSPSSTASSSAAPSSSRSAAVSVSPTLSPMPSPSQTPANSPSRSPTAMVSPSPSVTTSTTQSAAPSASPSASWAHRFGPMSCVSSLALNTSFNTGQCQILSDGLSVNCPGQFGSAFSLFSFPPYVSEYKFYWEVSVARQGGVGITTMPKRSGNYHGCTSVTWMNSNQADFSYCPAGGSDMFYFMLDTSAWILYSKPASASSWTQTAVASGKDYYAFLTDYGSPSIYTPFAVFNFGDSPFHGTIPTGAISASNIGCLISPSATASVSASPSYSPTISITPTSTYVAPPPCGRPLQLERSFDTGYCVIASDGLTVNCPGQFGSVYASYPFPRSVSAYTFYWEVTVSSLGGVGLTTAPGRGGNYHGCTATSWVNSNQASYSYCPAQGGDTFQFRFDTVSWTLWVKRASSSVWTPSNVEPNQDYYAFLTDYGSGGSYLPQAVFNFGDSPFVAETMPAGSVPAKYIGCLVTASATPSHSPTTSVSATTSYVPPPPCDRALQLDQSFDTGFCVIGPSGLSVNCPGQFGSAFATFPFPRSVSAYKFYWEVAVTNLGGVGLTTMPQRGANYHGCTSTSWVNSNRADYSYCPGQGNSVYQFMFDSSAWILYAKQLGASSSSFTQFPVAADQDYYAFVTDYGSPSEYRPSAEFNFGDSPFQGSLPTGAIPANRIGCLVSLSAAPSVSRSPSFSATETPSSSRSPSVTRTPSRSRSLSPIVSPSGSRTRSPSVSSAASLSPSSTGSRSESPSPSNSASASETPSSSVTASESVPASQSVTVSASESSTSTISASESGTVTASVTASITASITSSMTSSVSPSVTGSVSLSPTSSLTGSISLSSSPTASITVSKSLTPSITPTPSATRSFVPPTSCGLSVRFNSTYNTGPCSVSGLTVNCAGQFGSAHTNYKFPRSVSAYKFYWEIAITRLGGAGIETLPDRGGNYHGCVDYAYGYSNQARYWSCPVTGGATYQLMFDTAAWILYSKVSTTATWTQSAVTANQDYYAFLTDYGSPSNYAPLAVFNFGDTPFVGALPSGAVPANFIACFP